MQKEHRKDKLETNETGNRGLVEIEGIEGIVFDINLIFLFWIALSIGT